MARRCLVLWMIAACHRSVYDAKPPPSSQTTAAPVAKPLVRANETVVASAPARDHDITSPVRLILPDLASITLQSSFISLADGAAPIDAELEIDGEGIDIKQTVHVTTHPQPLKLKATLKLGAYRLRLRAPGAGEQAITFTVADTQLLQVYATHPPPRIAGAYHLARWSLVRSPWGKKPDVMVERATWAAGAREILVDVADTPPRDLADLSAELGAKDLVIAGQTVRLDQAADHFEASWLSHARIVRVIGTQLDADAQLLIGRYVRNFPPGK